MSQAEHPDRQRPGHEVTLADVRQLMGASTPHFALQLRNRIAKLIRGDVFFWQSLQAAGILVAVPIAFAFNLMLERFIAGFTMGAVKG